MTTKKRAQATRAKVKSAKQVSGPKAQAGFCAAARAARMPDTIHPMLATLVDNPFSSPEWIFETKWDGFRSICFVKNGKSRFVSRNQIDMTPQYPETR